MTNVPSAPPAEAAKCAAPAGALAKKKGIDPRYLSASLLTLLLIVGEWQFQILGDYKRMALSLSVAVAAELVCSKLMRGRWANVISAYISGNSIVILVKPAAGIWWPFWGGALISIVSKYVLTYRGQHLWNPTNFAMCAMMLLAPNSVSLLSHQWGNAWASIAFIWAVGLLVVWRARVLHLTLSYMLLFAAFAWLRTLVNHQPFLVEVAPITGPMYTLFMFFMVTDPRTIIPGFKRQIGIVAIIAALECAIRLACDFEWISTSNPLSFAPPMYALFIVGPIALWIELWRKGHAARLPS